MKELSELFEMITEAPTLNQGSCSVKSHGKKVLESPGITFGELKSHEIFSLHNPCFFVSKLTSVPGY